MSEQTKCGSSDFAAAYAVHALPSDEVATFETHLESCGDCRSQVEQLRAVVDTFIAWPTDILRAPTGLWKRLSARMGIEGDNATSHRIEAETEWTTTAPGIQTKVLALDTDRHCVSMLVRLAPGVDYPPHTHGGTEELHLLSGELWINENKLLPGDYNRAEAGTADRRVWSETGCTCVLVTSTRDVLG
jgi:anti-sigma factor ChrR (cupin superfamily)